LRPTFSARLGCFVIGTLTTCLEGLTMSNRQHAEVTKVPNGAGISIASREIPAGKPRTGEVLTDRATLGRDSKRDGISLPSREVTGRKVLDEMDPARRQRVEERMREIPRMYRNGYLRAAAGKASPRAAVKAFCLECVCWEREEVRSCSAVACPLYEYRPWKG
jgi:hypothetical protein